MADLLVQGACYISLLSIGIMLIRFFKGPSLLDRLVAFDGMSIITISLIALTSHILGRLVYLDVALVYGLLSFIGVIVVARYKERGL